MAKNIEMNNLNSDGTYEVVYPKTRQELVINLLNDSTKSFMGLDSTATADDAFKKVYLTNLLNGKSMVEVTFLDSETSQPMQGVIVTCPNFCDASGTSLTSHTTDINGKFIGFVNSINPTINISGYMDINDFSTTLNVDSLGKEYAFSFNLTTQNFQRYTSSTSKKFSGNVDYINVTVVGGGGGGGSGFGWTRDDDTFTGSGGGGGGGGYCVVQENVDFTINKNESIVIGAGGKGGPSDTSTSQRRASDGANGGSSSFLGIIANGGIGGSKSITGGAGNGKGGNGANQAGSFTAGTTGGNGTVYGYSSFTDLILYGGGGGGGNAGWGKGQISGGLDCGGSGGDYAGDETRKEESYGGGGGGGYDYKSGAGGGFGGGSGCVAIRMYLKSRQ